MRPFVIFSPQTSNRLEYITDYIFNQRLGVPFKLASTFPTLAEADVCVINYSHEEHENTFTIKPEGLLFETGIRAEKPDFTTHSGQIRLFSQHGGHLTFDVLSAIFYFISRYEEYQPYTPDKHGRFSGSQSLAYQHGVHLEPVVDIWILELKQALERHFGQLPFKTEQYQFEATIDIDNPWCYLNKGFKRTLGGLVRDALKGDVKKNWVRLKVLMRLEPDPHYTFDYLQQIHSTYGITPLFFLLVGRYGKFDKTASLINRNFTTFIRELSRQHEVGIHPSYEASDHRETFEAELDYLGRLCGAPITKSRQHYLKFTLPQYYQELEQLGIAHDYSMGFADVLGFRAGTSRPFPFFDLEKNIATKLTLHPFSVMERTLSDYLKLNPEASFELIQKVMTHCRKTNGIFVTLWHNESLSNTMEWHNWRGLYKKTVELATK